MDCICLIAAPRTGANHLSGVLRNFSELLVTRGVFDADGIEGLDTGFWSLLKRLTGIPFTSARDPELLAYARTDPTGLLNALEVVARQAGKRHFTFKFGPDGLDLERAERDVMGRSGLRAMLVVRRQIDCFISLRKALAIGSWHSVDTAEVSVELDADEFAEWLEAQERWYAHWREWFARRYIPLPVVRYETHIDQPLDAVLRRFVSAAAQVGITLRQPFSIEYKGYYKQDRTTAMFEKVSNWPAFSRAINARGLERRAFGYPI